MEHTAETNFLIDQLIRISIKNLSEADAEHHKQSALRKLANSHFARTNQFEVTARLDGLEEKWRINNDDPRAETLNLRRAELSIVSNEWTPELLSLLLQLSDRTAGQSNHADLATVKPELSQPTSPTWADIVAEDPLDDQDGIWKNVDFTADSSDDGEQTESVHSDLSLRTPGFSVIEPADEARSEALIESATTTSFHKVQNAKFWNMHDVETNIFIREKDENCRPNATITELQAIREVVFLLLGLPTSIFSQGNEGQTILSEAVILDHLSQESLKNLLQGFVVIANKLLTIRQCVREDERIPLGQTFQAALASRIKPFDRALSRIQTKILSHNSHFVPSLLKLYDEIYSIGRLLLQVYDVLLELEISSKVERPFRILECLFDRTCVNQDIGDAEGYEYMANLFFDCFQTYLKPIRLWMEKGQLTGRDSVIFIEKVEKNVPSQRVWQDQYHFKYKSNGDLHAPKFLHVAAKKIFNTGRSIDFLGRLGIENHDLSRLPVNEGFLTYETVCQSASYGLFSPFAALFDLALDKWIANKHQASSLKLRAQLELRCDLQASLNALEYVYIGAVSTNFNDNIFEKIDRGTHGWNNGLIMTDLFQGTFSSTGRLEIRLIPAAHGNSSRSMSALEDIRVSYTLPWPIVNVITTESTLLYQRVFVFLTQLQRAKYLIYRHKIFKSVRPTDQQSHCNIYTLRHRLLWLTNTIQTYITDMVLSVATADMRIAMNQAEDMDSMITVHQAYIRRLEDQCLLHKKHESVRQAIISLLDLTILFSHLQALNQIGLDSKSSLTNTKASQKHTKHAGEENAARSLSNEDEYSDATSDDSSSCPALHAQLPDAGSLERTLDTFRDLLSFVTAAVRGISKTDSAPSWEMLANNLAMGLEK